MSDYPVFEVGDLVNSTASGNPGDGKVVELTQNVNGSRCYMIEFSPETIKKIHPCYLTKMGRVKEQDCIYTSLLGVRNRACQYGSHSQG